jgi:hypothetical protein
MAGNRGKTSLKCRRRRACAMQEYDRLPPELRGWLAGAVLPWGPRSVARAYRRALARSRDQAGALAELDRIERRLVARDAGKVWGAGHPSAV